MGSLSDLPSPLSTTTTRAMSFETSSRRKYFYAACVCIAAVCIIGLLATTVRTLGQPSLYPIISQESEGGLSLQTCPQTPSHSDPINYLNGPPTDRFRGSICSSIMMVLKAN